jgi:hypothetical protein
MQLREQCDKTLTDESAQIAINKITLYRMDDTDTVEPITGTQLSLVTLLNIAVRKTEAAKGNTANSLCFKKLENRRTKPPSRTFSSTVTNSPVLAANSRINWRSRGLMKRTLTTATEIPSSAN